MRILKDMSKSDVGKDMRKIPTREEFHQKIASPILCPYDFETGKRNSIRNEAIKTVKDIYWTKMNSKVEQTKLGNWQKAKEFLEVNKYGEKN